MAATTLAHSPFFLDTEDKATVEAMGFLDMFMPDREWENHWQKSSFKCQSLVTDSIANHSAADQSFPFETLPDEMRKAVMVQAVLEPTLGQFVCFGPYTSEFRGGDQATSAIHIKKIWPTRMMLVSKTCYNDAIYACWTMFKDCKFITRFEHHPKVDKYTKHIPMLFHKCQQVSMLARMPAPKIRLTILLPRWFERDDLPYKIDWIRMFLRNPEMLDPEKLEIRFLAGAMQTRKGFLVFIVKELLKLKRIAKKIVEEKGIQQDECLAEPIVEHLIKKFA